MLLMEPTHGSFGKTPFRGCFGCYGGADATRVRIPQCPRSHPMLRPRGGSTATGHLMPDVHAAEAQKLRKYSAKLKSTHQPHFFIRSSSPSAHARATAGPASSCPGILSQPPFSMASGLCQLFTSSSAFSFSSGFGCFMNWATQIAARLAKTASLVIVSVVPEVVQPPHANPMIIAIAAPQIRPHTPYVIFAVVSGFIDKTSSIEIPDMEPCRLSWRRPRSSACRLTSPAGAWSRSRRRAAWRAWPSWHPLGGP
jgi:hypothetical protein